MSGLFADRPCFRRTPLAFALCLLAMLFAVEAKAICYEPANCLHSNVQREKALPVDLASVSVAGVPQISRPAFPSALLILASGAADEWGAPGNTSAPRVQRTPVAAYAGSRFLPCLFRRPPPAL